MTSLTKSKNRGFTLTELMVVISIVGILSGIVYANFSSARAAARDDVRKSDLKQLELAVTMYRAQHGHYPSMASSIGACVHDSNFTPIGCQNYIIGLVPDFIPALPRDPRFSDRSYQYRVSVDRQSYKILTQQVEVKTISSENEDFARCPDFSSCGGTGDDRGNTYAVFGGPGSAGW